MEMSLIDSGTKVSVIDIGLERGFSCSASLFDTPGLPLKSNTRKSCRCASSRRMGQWSRAFYGVVAIIPLIS